MLLLLLLLLLCSSARMQFMPTLLCLSHPADAIARACIQYVLNDLLSPPSSTAAIRASSNMSLKEISATQKAHWRVTGTAHRTHHTHTMAPVRASLQERLARLKTEKALDSSL